MGVQITNVAKGQHKLTPDDIGRANKDGRLTNQKKKKTLSPFSFTKDIRAKF